MGRLSVRIRSALARRPVACRHSRGLRDVEPLTPHGCGECLHAGEDSVHLRLCMECGHVGCAQGDHHDHARTHYRESGHPVVARFTPVDTPSDGERPWYWCYACEALVVGPA